MSLVLYSTRRTRFFPAMWQHVGVCALLRMLVVASPRTRGTEVGAAVSAGVLDKVILKWLIEGCKGWWHDHECASVIGGDWALNQWKVPALPLLRNRSRYVATTDGT